MPGAALAAGGVKGIVLSVTGRLHGEEAGAAPGRPGDGACDRRQAGIGVALPDIAVGLDRDGVAPALMILLNSSATTAGVSVCVVCLLKFPPK